MFWNLSGTFRTRDDRGEGGTFVSEGVVRADGLSLLLVSFGSGVDTGFAGLGVWMGEDLVDADGSFDKTTAKRARSLGILPLGVSCSFDCGRDFTGLGVEIGDEVEVKAGLEVTIEETVGTVSVRWDVSKAQFSFCFEGTTVAALDLGLGEGVACFSEAVAWKLWSVFGLDVLFSKFVEVLERSLLTAGEVGVLGRDGAVGCFLVR